MTSTTVAPIRHAGLRRKVEHTSSLLSCRHGSSKLTASRQPELQDHILAGRTSRTWCLESAPCDLLDSIERRTG